MTEKFINLMRQHAENVLGSRIYIKCGTVFNYDPENYLVRVKFASVPEDVVTGWLKIASPSSDIFIGPNVGDMCQVLFSDGDINGGVVNLFWGVSKPSIPVNSGDVLIDQSGVINVYSSSTISIGNKNDIFRKVIIDTFKDLFNNHTHPDIGSPPTQQITSDHLSANTNVN
jgi:hypothetical protein